MQLLKLVAPVAICLATSSAFASVTCLSSGITGYNYVNPSLSVYGGVTRYAFIESVGDPASNIGSRVIYFNGTSFTTIFSGECTAPRISRDGTIIVFWARYNPSSPFSPYVPWAFRTDLPVSGSNPFHHTSTNVGWNGNTGTVGPSTAILNLVRNRPPAVTDKFVQMGFWEVYYEDPCAETAGEDGPQTPLMTWRIGTSGSTQVWQISGTNNHTSPATSGVEPSLSQDLYLCWVRAGTNGQAQVYRAKRTLTGIVPNWTPTYTNETLVSGTPEGNLASTRPECSTTGRYVVFQSLATNFTASDTNGDSDIYWKDMTSGGPTAAYTLTGSIGGSSIPSISPDGSMIGFQTVQKGLFPTGVNWNTRLGPFACRVGRGAPATLTLLSFQSGTSAPKYARNGGFTSIADSGKTLFDSDDTGLATGDTRVGFDIFDHN